MSARATQAAPLRFLIAVVALWVAGRGAVLMGWRPPAELRKTAHIDLARLLQPGVASAAIPALVHIELPATPTPAPSEPRQAPATSVTIVLEEPSPGDASQDEVDLAALATPAPPHPTYRHADGRTESAAIIPPATPHPVSRWSGSAWAFVRGGGRATALSPNGQIGGGQAGTRLLYRLDDQGRFAASARISRTIGGIRQAEAAVGLDWTPLAALPVHVMIERRIAIDKGGRNAWTLGAAGGVYAVPIGPRWRFDAYAEAGVVGIRRRDLYADGAARIGRAIDLGTGRSLAVGPGIWGAAQPDAARVDAGPSAVLRLPIDGKTLAVALDWRQRLTGGARPHSGVALTVGVDF